MLDIVLLAVTRLEQFALASRRSARLGRVMQTRRRRAPPVPGLLLTSTELEHVLRIVVLAVAAAFDRSAAAADPAVGGVLVHIHDIVLAGFAGRQMCEVKCQVRGQRQTTLRQPMLDQC